MNSVRYIGTAGWSIPKTASAHFDSAGSHLERYAKVFNCTEINSSFYRPHRLSTYERWGDTVPDGFRFSVKVPKAITHSLRLKHPEPLLDAFLSQIAGLREKLGYFLVQLPPSLKFDESVASHFWSALRNRTSVPIAFEPRHPSWGKAESISLLRENQIDLVMADPNPAAFENPFPPRGVYLRLHGQPEIYYSSYTDSQIQAYARKLDSDRAQRQWCIFDNTALGHATTDALNLMRRTSESLNSLRHAGSR